MNRIDVAASEDVLEGKPTTVKHEGVCLLLTRIDGTVHAVENKCAHLGMSLAKGRIEDGAIVCPWHGSKFDMQTGENKDWVNGFAGKETPKWTHKLIAMGKKPAPIQSYAIEEEDGRIFATVPA